MGAGWCQEVIFTECSFDQAQLRIGNGTISAAQIVVRGTTLKIRITRRGAHATTTTSSDFEVSPANDPHSGRTNDRVAEIALGLFQLGLALQYLRVSGKGLRQLGVPLQ
ncbi:MAG TPA: hypothetical protein VK752_12270 [Bryobacteraceae bacterium]|jgi:hypothetical protein|nr:hypothetical protein [Bryobacteraceae bacterium]